MTLARALRILPLLLIAALTFPFPLPGSNLALRHGVVIGSRVQLEMAWDHSWDHSAQQGSADAVWVFAKGLHPAQGWVHIPWSVNPTDHVAFGDVRVVTVPDGQGLFMGSALEQGGDLPFFMVDLLSARDLSVYAEVRIFGIAMVRIPQSPFFLGDGASVSSFATAQGQPVRIASEAAIAGGSIALHNPNAMFAPHPLPSTIPGAYPKGFAAFYAMRFELSQGQYADFLNTLTYSQQRARTAIPPSSPPGSRAMVSPQQPDSLFRNAIVIAESGQEGQRPARYALDANANGVFNEEADGFHRAANFLSWADLSAYLDWAALRPLTEFEFERICRGGEVRPVPGEFAWGTALVTNANTVVRDGTPREGVAERPGAGAGLANHGSVVALEGWGLRGPLRTGFAATENSDRLTAGAAYYGAMEMSGNVWEMVVMAGGGGEQFTGHPGDGILTPEGYANQPGWGDPATASGAMYRGGAWNSAIGPVGGWRDLAVSDRYYSHLRPVQRRSTSGGRGGR